jgi:hypothetical protein
MSDEEQPPLAKRGGADKDLATTCNMAGHGAREGVVTVWERDREEFEREREEKVECAHEVPELPV